MYQSFRSSAKEWRRRAFASGGVIPGDPESSAIRVIVLARGKVIITLQCICAYKDDPEERFPCRYGGLLGYLKG